MSLVNFYKGKSYDYNEDNHSNGIYQCIDTGDTYIFGVKNGNSANDGNILIIDMDDLMEDENTISLNSFNQINNAITNNYKQIIFKSAYIDANEQQIDYFPVIKSLKESSYIYLYIISSIGMSPELIVGDMFYLESSSIIVLAIDTTTRNVLQYNLISNDITGDGTKFLSDNGFYKSISLGDITSIQEVTALPSSPDANTLYLIPEDSSESGSGESPLG